MRRRDLGWVVCLTWGLVGCVDEDPDRNADADSDAGLDGGAIADAELDASADAGADADTGADAAPVVLADDQTPPSGANGLALDAEGMVWLADLFGNQVLRIDPDGGGVIERHPRPGAGPDDIAIDGQGRVFWTGWSNGRVGRIDPKTGESSIIATLPLGANSIAFSKEGRLFVGLVILGSGLYELDPEGEGEPRLVLEDIGSLNGFTFGPDGFLWGPLDDEIVRIDVEAGEIIESVADGSYSSVRYSESDDALYALTNGENRDAPALDRIDLDSYAKERVTEPDLASVDNFALRADGHFLITAFDVPELLVLDPEATRGVTLSIGDAASD